ncbi:hypothetical protein BY996DRAFT_6576810 [Phakopsora pachyrhizi]|nr:hypothetical protein BY996DRAFT_6576810 [Phakopsora pachyrhizi]
MSPKTFDETNAKLDNLKQARLIDWQLFKDNGNELVNKREQRQTLVPNKLGKKRDENSNLGQATIERRPGKFGSLRFLRGKDILNYRSDQKIKVQSNQINNRIERCLALVDRHGPPAMGKDKTRSELEGRSDRARAWKCKQAGLLPLPEDEDEGDQSDKTQLLKQITGDGKGEAAQLERIENKERVKEEKGCLRRIPQPEHLAREPIPMAPIPEHQSEEDQLQQRVGRLRNWRMDSRSSISDKKFAGNSKEQAGPDWKGIIDDHIKRVKLKIGPHSLGNLSIKRASGGIGQGSCENLPLEEEPRTRTDETERFSDQDWTGFDK